MRNTFIVLLAVIALCVVTPNNANASQFPSNNVYWIPAVAVGEFPSGYYTTELSIRNTHSTSGYTVKTEFAPFGGTFIIDTKNALAESETEMKRQMVRVYPDYLGDELEITGDVSGFMRIQSEKSLNVNCIVRNTGFGPEVNQTVPVIRPVDMFNEHVSAELFRVVRGDETYFNVFILNAGDEPIMFDVELLDSDFQQLGIFHFTVDALSADAMTNIARMFNIAELNDGLVRITPVQGSGPWYAMGSRVEPSGDNVTVMPWAEPIP